METITSPCAKGKVAYEGYAISAWCAHGGTLWWENNKGVVGEDFLLDWNERRHKALCLHMCKMPKYQSTKSIHKKKFGLYRPFPIPLSPFENVSMNFMTFPGMGRDKCHICGGR
jgi:hypothetical protein